MDSLASQYSFKYEVLKADIDEKAVRHDSPRDLVLALAHAKADALLQKLAAENSSSSSSSTAAGGAADGSSNSSSSGGTFLITCDQVVVHDGQIREKPEDVAEAHRWA
jgi:septum formation protein